MPADRSALAIVAAALALSLASPAPAARTAPASIGVTAVRDTRIAVPGTTVDRMTVAVPMASWRVAGGVGHLELEKQSVRAADYRVLLQRPDGSLRVVPAGPVRTYRGTVAGVDGSTVAAYLGDDGLHARIRLSDDEVYWVQPAPARVRGDRSSHIVFRGDDIIASNRTCAANAPAEAAAGMDGGGGDGAGGDPLPGGSGDLMVAEIAIDADHEYFQHWGSIAAVEDRVNAVINAVNIQYERDVAITHQITAIIVRTTAADPYTQAGSSALLDQFRVHWNANHDDIPRDIAQLFTGRDLAGGTIGSGYLNVICHGSYGYSIAQSDWTSNFAGVTDLSAHELGHNWSAGHCSCANPGGYTMNPSITSANAFDPSSTVPGITAFRDSLACLDAETAELPGDADSNGVVNMADLILVIQSWGGCAPLPLTCPADVTDDGMVGVDDLVLVVEGLS